MKTKKKKKSKKYLDKNDKKKEVETGYGGPQIGNVPRIERKKHAPYKLQTPTQQTILRDDKCKITKRKQ